MSAYMVEDKTINNIVAGIKRGFDNHGLDYPDFNRNDLNSFGLSDLDGTNLAKIGGYLFVMNIEAIEQRYGEGEAKTFRPLDYQYRSIIWPDAINLYKSIRCLLYQCTEGNVPETTIYKTLEEFARDIAEHIVHRLPAYENGEWE